MANKKDSTTDASSQSILNEPTQRTSSLEIKAYSTRYPDFESGAHSEASNQPKDDAVVVSDGADIQDQTNDTNEDDYRSPNQEHRVDGKPYSVFTHNEKRIIVLLAGLCSFFSPISSSIYFPSLDAISKDLHVSFSLVNLTITTYMVSAPSQPPELCTDFSPDYARSRACICRRIL